MKRILKVIVGEVAGLACTSTKAKAGSVVGGVDLGVSGGNKRLGVTVCKCLGTLTCESRCEAGVDWHLVIGDLSEGVRGDCTFLSACVEEARSK